jgi:hypothetical protein
VSRVLFTTDPISWGFTLHPCYSREWLDDCYMYKVDNLIGCHWYPLTPTSRLSQECLSTGTNMTKYGRHPSWMVIERERRESWVTIGQWILTVNPDVGGALSRASLIGCLAGVQTLVLHCDSVNVEVLASLCYDDTCTWETERVTVISQLQLQESRSQQFEEDSSLIFLSLFRSVQVKWERGGEEVILDYWHSKSPSNSTFTVVIFPYIYSEQKYKHNT